MGYEEFKAVIDIIVCLSSVGLGFGVSCWILGIIIDKSNNFGDNLRTNADYGAFIRFSYRRDNLSFKERKSFCKMYSVKTDGPSSEPDGSDLVRRLSKEELAEYENTTVERAAAKRYNMLAGREEKQAIFDCDISGVFSPLKDE